jgi:hypothetical protein
MSADLTILKSIQAYYPHPSRRFYCRCWGCGERRFLANWWEGHQLGAHWGFFCGHCTVIIASMRLDAMNFARDAVRIETLDEALDQFTYENVLLDPAASAVCKRIKALQADIEHDCQTNGY